MVVLIRAWSLNGMLIGVCWRYIAIGYVLALVAFRGLCLLLYLVCVCDFKLHCWIGQNLSLR